MGLFNELKKLTKPVSEDEEFFEDEEQSYTQDNAGSASSYTDYADAPEEEPAPRRSSFLGNRRESTDRTEREDRPSSRQVQMTVVAPKEFAEAADIADQLRQRRSVLLNLEETPLDVARRLVDFLSGATYVMDGKIQRVSAKTFILTTSGVDLMGSAPAAGNDNYFD